MFLYYFLGHNFIVDLHTLPSSYSLLTSRTSVKLIYCQIIMFPCIYVTLFFIVTVKLKCYNFAYCCQIIHLFYGSQSLTSSRYLIYLSAMTFLIHVLSKQHYTQVLFFDNSVYYIHFGISKAIFFP